MVITLIASELNIFRNSKKLRLSKDQETSGLLSNLGLKTSLSRVPMLGDILF